MAICSRCVRTLLLCLIFSVIAGCAARQVKPEIGARSEAEIALRNIPKYVLTHCDTSLGAVDNSVGSLLDDYNEVSSKGAICASKHDPLVDYLIEAMQRLGLLPPGFTPTAPGPSPVPSLPTPTAAKKL